MSAESARAAFEALPWVDVAPGAREKLVRHESVRLRLLELTPAFVEEGWCVRGHAGIVLEGVVEITRRSGTIEVRQGDGIFLAPGEAGAHRARAVVARALLFLVEQG